MNAGDAEQARSIRQEGAAEMEKAVEDQGLTGETYIRIFNTVKDDAELRGKTARMILEEQKNR